MSYVRPMRVDELVKWLMAHGVMQDQAEELANALWNDFDVIGTSHTAS